MAVSGYVPRASGRCNARWRLVLLQSCADAFDEFGRIVPQSLVGVRGYRDVLKSSHRRHESGHPWRRLNRCDPCEFADIVLGVRHVRCFQVPMSSSVVVIVASSDSVLSMIEVA